MGSLKKMVPGAKDYAGSESLTYDTDRLVGCSWKGKTTDGVSRSLSLSLVRVVSYDPTVSDEAQASSDFDDKASAASIPSSQPSGSPSGSTTPTSPSSTPSGQSTSSGADASAGNNAGDNASSGTGGGTGGSPAGAGSSTSPAAPNGVIGANGADNATGTSPDLAPRRLSGVGNAAFINDVAKTPGTDANRTVTLVFRVANVLATVSYTQSSPADAQPPKSADLQKDAEKVASDLQHKVEG
jgi:hypothetical protein